MQCGDSRSENQLALYPPVHKEPYLQANQNPEGQRKELGYRTNRVPDFKYVSTGSQSCPIKNPHPHNELQCLPVCLYKRDHF